MAFSVKVNGRDFAADVDGDTPLLWFLRHVLGLTGTKLPGRPSRQLALWGDGARAAGGDRARDERVEAAAAPRRRGPGHEAQCQARALSREAITRSADLQRRYAVEYASMLRVIGDREVAREAARINVSALLMGQSRIVPVEGRFAADRFTYAIARSGEDLGAIRRAV